MNFRLLSRDTPVVSHVSGLLHFGGCILHWALTSSSRLKYFFIFSILPSHFSNYAFGLFNSLKTRALCSLLIFLFSTFLFSVLEYIFLGAWSSKRKELELQPIPLYILEHFFSKPVCWSTGSPVCSLVLPAAYWLFL